MSALARGPIAAMFVVASGVWLMVAPRALCAAERGPQAAAGLARPASAAAESLPASGRIDRWIADLRDDSYAVRQAAARQLLSAGIAARQPLAALAVGPDPETRAAARRLLVLIDQAEFTRQLEAFAADTDGKQGRTLPGWEEFRALVGGDAAARALFVEMQRHEAALLAEHFDGPAGAESQPWEGRLTRLSLTPPTPDGRRRMPALGSCATMFFLSSVVENGTSISAAMNLANLVRRQPVASAVRGPLQDEAMRRLIVHWVIQCPNRSDAVLQQRLGLAQELELREAVPLALGVAVNDPAFVTASPVYRGLALSLVGQLGSRGDVEQLEPLLDDATACVAAQAPTATTPIQIRDIALVAMLQLTGQSPTEYGYPHARLTASGNYDIQSLHPDSDAVRASAAAKWRAWKSAQRGQVSLAPRDPAEAGQGS